MSVPRNHLIQWLGFILLAGLLVVYALKQEAHAAGFDCSRASTDVEKYICGNEQVNDLDRILNEVYTDKLKSVPQSERAKVRQEQHAWLEHRNECYGYLPAEEDRCFVSTYKEWIVALGGFEKLVSYYKGLCSERDWYCKVVGELERGQGNYEEAVKYYSIMCDADHDGDQGDSCYQKAVLLEKMGKIAEARTLYKQTCENRYHNEACAAAERLTSKVDLQDSWSGLYRSDTGTLYIKKNPDGSYSFNMDTTWANGHQCGYTGKFILKDGEPVVPADKEFPECQPKIVKNGDAVSIEDPTGQCRSLCGARASFAETFHKEQ